MKQLSDKEKKYHAILESTAEGIIVLSKDLKIDLCNHSACRLFDYSKEEIKTKHINDLIKSLDTHSKKLFSSILTDPNSDNFYQMLAIRKDNTTIPLELSIASTELSNEKLIICVLRNSYERMQHDRRTELRHQIVRTMVDYSASEEAYSQIIKTICDNLNFDLGLLWKLDHLGKILFCSNAWSNKKSNKLEKFIEASKKISFEKGIGLPGRVWKSKQLAIIEVLELDKNFPRLSIARGAQLKTGFALPILFKEEVIGVIEFFTRSSFSYDANLIAMLNDITNQIGIYIEREYAQKRVAILSRMAGMAEVASSVLHNVGNVLNSVNVSAGFLVNKIKNSELAALIKIKALLEENIENINEFIIIDPRGKVLVKYIIELANYWQHEKDNLLNELHSLINNIEHINNIIHSQQGLVVTGGRKEKVIIADLINEALNFTITQSKLNNILVTREFPTIEPFMIEKVKVLQILVNLIRNAYDSLMESTNNERLLHLKVSHEKKIILIHIMDNGVGISQENILKIFSFGFTTKKEGHGFGLNASVLAAKELGGKLSAQSAGLGKGATFLLELPFDI